MLERIVREVVVLLVGLGQAMAQVELPATPILAILGRCGLLASIS